MKRKSNAVWKGSGKEGHGHLSTQSTILQQTQYSFSSRFEQGIGTNPEELIAAAHAGCFSMKLSFVLGALNITPQLIETDCTITLDNGTITQSELAVRVKADGISQIDFDAAIADAKVNCPISKLFNCEISIKAELLP